MLRMKRTRVLWFVVPAIIALTALAVVHVRRWYLRSHPVDVAELTVEQVQSATMLLPDAETVAEGKRSIADPNQIALLIKTLQERASASYHKCAPHRRLCFHLRNGHTVTCQLLPGHVPGFYEYRNEAGAFRVNAGPFFQVMQELGVRRELLITDQSWDQCP